MNLILNMLESDDFEAFKQRWSAYKVIGRYGIDGDQSTGVKIRKKLKESLEKVCKLMDRGEETQGKKQITSDKCELLF